MKFKYSFILSLLLGSSLSALAVPAKPGVMTFTQPDGTEVEATLVGDEHFHYYETTQGEILLRDAAGTLRPAVFDARGRVVAEGNITGKATPLATAKQLRMAMTQQLELEQAQKAPARQAPDRIPLKFPTTGTVGGLIVLAEFQDVKFTDAATPERFEKLVNGVGYSEPGTTYGSVYDYFTAQSQGKFTPHFDVVGPITLPQKRAYYGTQGTMEELARFYKDAALAADAAGADFSKFDLDNDGFVDFFFVVFAGHGEAQGGPAESIWPAMMDCSYYVFNFFDGLNLSVAACACELKGASGTTLDGIGTICHEFSHILGLADIYDSRNGGGYGMGHYDLMDIGTYNMNQFSPSGYTAMDKFTVGWLDPIVLDKSQTGVRLEPFEQSNQAAFIVNPDNPNEYYTLENRQQKGWDQGLPGHGLVISYCHYVPDLWARNVVNAITVVPYQHVALQAADGNWNATTEDNDPFPGTEGKYTQFLGKTDGITPAGVWYSTGARIQETISNIQEHADGSITFDFTTPAGGIEDINDEAAAAVFVEGSRIIAPEGSAIYDLAGRRLGGGEMPAGIYVVHTPDGASVKVAVR